MSTLPMEWDGLSPEQRYENAQRAGKTYFLGIVGYALFVPGVEHYETQYADKIPIVILNEGTDCFRSDAERVRYKQAVIFAEAFNQLVLRGL